MVEMAVVVGLAERAAAGAAAALAARSAGIADVLVVVSDETSLRRLPETVTAIVDESSPPNESAALRAAADHAQREGADLLLVALPAALSTRAAAEPDSWRRLLVAPEGVPITVATSGGHPAGMLRLEAAAWPLLPFEGAVARLWQARPELVGEVALDQRSRDGAGSADSLAVEGLLGRPPAGGFEVVVRAADGSPVVIANAPFLDDGTPMPTRYWLVGRKERELVGRLESAGGVRRAEAEVDAGEIAAAHGRYAEERAALIPDGHRGRRPTGGVGGTRRGVKCLHAHLAWYLAGGGDPVGRWVTRQLDGELPGPVGALDCGTNSTRLLVRGRDGATLARRMIITRLGEGVDRTGELSEAAIERTVAALAQYRAVLDQFGVVRARACATSAARDATNVEDFFDAAEKVLGFRPELLEGSEEGRLSYRGATEALAPEEGPYLVIDLGGGSTEFVAGDPAGPEHPPAAIVSLDIGCVRVSERFLKSDPPREEEIAAARAYVRTTLSAALREQSALSVPRRMVGVAGTISTLVSLELGLPAYDSEAVHLAHISRPAVERWLAVLGEESAAERRKRPAIEPGRADVIVGGAAVLAESMAVLGFDDLVHSESDILDGIAAELAVG